MSFYEYSSAYLVPMPICEVRLGRARTTPSLGPLPAVIDTGADITIVPTHYLHHLRARRAGEGEARSVWGDARMVGIYLVSLALDSLSFRTLQVLSDDQGDEIIVGRFVLNRLKIILDGPAATVEIVEERPRR